MGAGSSGEMKGEGEMRDVSLVGYRSVEARGTTLLEVDLRDVSSNINVIRRHMVMLTVILVTYKKINLCDRAIYGKVNQFRFDF